MSNPADIENALRQKLAEALPASVGNTAFENQPFSRKGKAKWFEFHFLPNAPDVATLGAGGQDEFTGIAQLDIHVPIGSGKEAVAADILAMRSAFTPATPLVYNSAIVTVKSCGQVPGGQAENSYRFSVSISWETRLFRS